jgi:hypothetical protein
MEDTVTAYKVLKRYLSTEVIYGSLTVSPDDPWFLRYPLDGSWVNAPKSAFDRGFGICVFEDIYTAIGYTNTDVWLAECAGSMPLPDYSYQSNHPGLTASLDAFYIARSRSGYWPYSTLMFERIRLIRNIKWLIL